MFLIGLDSYCGMCFDNKIGTETANYMELKNGKYDEWKLDTGIVDYSSTKTLWDYTTLMLATFNNTLEAGNMANNGYEIEEVHFKRRKKTDLAWVTFAKMSYDPSQKYYQVIDRIASVGEYEYAFVPVTGNVEGVETIKDIVHTFDDLYVCDKDDSIRLIYDVEYGDINNMGNTSVINTLSGRYPYVMSTPLNYRQGTITAKIISQASIESRHIKIDSERQLREIVITFLTDRKAKVLKDGNGRSILCKIMNVREIPNSVFAGGICDVSFDYVEIGGESDFEKAGIMKYY